MPKQNHGKKRERLAFRKQQAQSHRPGGVRRLIVSGIIVVVILVLGLVGWSVYNFQVKPYNRTVMDFNGTSLDMRYFINQLKIYYQNAPVDTTISDYADYVLQQMQHNETIIQGSAALGVTIDTKTIEDQLKAAGAAVDREHIDVALAQALMDQQVPLTQPQYHVQALLLESSAAAETARARLAAGEPAANVSAELSRYSGTSIIQGDMGWVTPRQVELDFGSQAFGSLLAGSDNGTIGGPLYDDNVTKQYGFWIARASELTPATDNTSASAHVQGLLLGTAEAARQAIDQINAGADIDAVAKQLSQVPGVSNSGADLGWIPLTENAGEFAQLETLPLNTFVGPVGDNTTTTTGGYWVYRIADLNMNRALTGPQQEQLQTDWFDQCTAALQQDPNYKVDTLLTQDMKDFALNQVVLSLGKGSVLIATDSIPDAEAGVPYSVQLKTYGNDQGNTWSLTVGSLPDGLTLGTATGLISGTPALAGGAGFTVRVDSGLHYNDKELVIRIHIPVSIKSTLLPNGTANITYQQSIDFLGDADNITFSVVGGTLPDGVQLAAGSGLVYGKPTTAGTYTFTVKIDDGNVSDTRDMTITIDPPAPASP